MASLQSPRSDDSESDAELGRRRLEAAREAVSSWGSRGAAVDDSNGVYSAWLVAAVKDLVSLGSGGGAYAGDAKVALKAAMGHLEDDFRQLLSSGTYFQPSDGLRDSLHECIALPLRSFSFSSFPDLEDLSISSFGTSDESRTYGTGYSRHSVSMEKVHMYLIDPEASVLLKQIAEIMILSSHAPNLCRAYGETRHNTLMQCLCLLGIQIEPNGYYDAAELASYGGCSLQIYGQKQKMWIQALRVIVGTVLPAEHQACAEIFGCDSKVEEDCFARATTRCTGQLLAVGNVIANLKVNDQQYHKVPLLLQMHEEFVKLGPSIEGLLSGDAKDVVSKEASALLDKLGEAASSLLLEFLDVCSNHKPWQNTVLGGNLPLTQHVMGFIKLLAEYNDTVNLILPFGEEEEKGNDKGRTRSPWERYVITLLARLQKKIEESAESYKDERLRYIFLMNNAMCVLKGSRPADLRISLGCDWNHELNAVPVEQYATAYLRASWAGALFQLRDRGFGQEPQTRYWVRKSMKNFNLAFEEITRVQTTWKVPNAQLRQQLRLVILQQVLPAYRALMGRYGRFVDHNPSKYIKYDHDDIENHVLDLFEG